ncbi:MAG: LytR/AlgR family response regulator transcription factor [Bacteroidota bacterium]
MNKIKCVLVDDEPLALDVLESYIQRVDGLELTARCENALKAFEVLRNQTIDLIFLDIQMPKLNGIDFLKTIQNPPKVIFTTAYRDYALEAFDLDAVDYLLKPIPFGRFLKALSKAFGQINSSTQHTGNITGNEDYEPYISTDTLIVKSDKKMIKINLRDIIYIESLKDYVIIHLSDKRVVTKQKISFLEQKLMENNFIRIHRSFLVSASKIDAFTPSHIEINGQELPIGRSYKSEVGKILGY